MFQAKVYSNLFPKSHCQERKRESEASTWQVPHLSGRAGGQIPPRSWVKLLILTAYWMCCCARQSSASVLTSTRGVTGLESRPALRPAERSRMVWTALRSAALKKEKKRKKWDVFWQTFVFLLLCETAVASAAWLLSLVSATQWEEILFGPIFAVCSPSVLWWLDDS